MATVYTPKEGQRLPTAPDGNAYPVTQNYQQQGLYPGHAAQGFPPGPQYQGQVPYQGQPYGTQQQYYQQQPNIGAPLPYGYNAPTHAAPYHAGYPPQGTQVVYVNEACHPVDHRDRMAEECCLWGMCAMLCCCCLNAFN